METSSIMVMIFNAPNNHTKNIFLIHTAIKKHENLFILIDIPHQNHIFTFEHNFFVCVLI